MMKWINKKRNKKGFTLVELVVVIAILGILAAIAIPRFGGFTSGAKEAQAEANHRTIVSAAQMFYANAGKWTESITSEQFIVEASNPLIEEGFLTENDFKKPEGAKYSITTKEDETKKTTICTIKAEYNEKTWEWSSDAGFIEAETEGE